MPIISTAATIIGAAAGVASAAADPKVADAANEAGKQVESLFASIANWFSTPEEQKKREELRQNILESADKDIYVSDLLKQLEKRRQAEAQPHPAAKLFLKDAGPLNAKPGCFVFATYRTLDFDKDLYDYTAIFVGKAENVADGVMAAMSRTGNADVYADVKFRQNVRLYVFYCEAEELDERCETLIDALGARESYNAE